MPVPGLCLFARSDDRVWAAAARGASCCREEPSQRTLLTPLNLCMRAGGLRAKRAAASAEAEAAKAAGNDAFKAGAFQDAVDAYSRAIALDPTRAVYHSNRAQAYLQVHCNVHVFGASVALLGCMATAHAFWCLPFCSVPSGGLCDVGAPEGNRAACCSEGGWCYAALAPCLAVWQTAGVCGPAFSCAACAASRYLF